MNSRRTEATPREPSVRGREVHRRQRLDGAARSASARQEGRIDREVTDAVVMAAVKRQRWFWLLLLKRGPIRDQSQTEIDQIQAAHLRHLFTLRKRGQLALFGPVDGAGTLRAIGVLTVSTREEAETLMADDPAVRSGRLRAEIRPWFTMPGDRLPD